MRFSDRIRAAYDGFTGKSETAENAAKQSETAAQHVLSHAPLIPPGLAEDIAFGDYDRRDLWAAEYNVAWWSISWRARSRRSRSMRTA